ncbi:MAG: CBS domain-containing protein [Coriobacteriia bacterium]|nr:CBS domain-containing protein [Coriobacteriia bacterium]
MHGRAGRTIVVGHANPDFDAYAATVAATKLFPGAHGVFLGTQNTNVREFHHLHEGFLDFVELKGLDLGTIERLVMVDTRDPGRVGELRPVALDPAVEVVVYDHHPPMADDLERAEDRSEPVGATTSILVHEIRERGLTLTPLECSLMLLGIHEDTGSLTYPGATAYDADAVAFLMSAGADMEVVNQFLYRSPSAAQQELVDLLTASLELWDVNGRRIAVGHARVDDYVDSAGVVTHHLVEDLGHRVAVAVIEMPGRTQVVGRSRIAEVDIGAVLEHLGGGGHAQAASAALRSMPMGDVDADLRAALAAEVRAPLTARDIASSPVRTATPATTMHEAGEQMLRWGHGALPVVEHGAVVGLVTRKDVDKAVRHGLAHAPVKGFMARDIVTAGPDTDLDTLERLLTAENIGRIPVLDDGVLVGIVTRKDVLRAEHGDSYLDRGLPQARDDATRRFLESVDALLPEEVRGAIREIGVLAEGQGTRAYVVGGFVRDMLLGRRNLDVDVVVEGDGIAFADLAAERLGGRVKAHMRFGTAVLVLSRHLHVDVTSARTEYYTRPGALPTVERSSLRQDLLRRDFSINAMAAAIDPAEFGEIADPFGGLRDLHRGSIRALHSLSFVEDPTRVMRAARFERRFGFVMEPSTLELARHAVDMGLLGDISGARIRQELFAILEEEPALSPLQRLDELGALSELLPEGVSPADALADVAAMEATLHEMPCCVGRAPRRVTALLVALGGRGTPHATERWAHWLRVGRENAAAPIEAATRAEALLRSLRDARPMRDSRLHALLDGCAPETLAYVRGRGGAGARARVDRYITELSPIRLEVTGDDLAALGAAPSPAFSAILHRALADRLDGAAVGRTAELANLRRLAKKAGLLPR